MLGSFFEAEDAAPETMARARRAVRDAVERYDVARLVTLLHDDVVMSMRPDDFWPRGS